MNFEVGGFAMQMLARIATEIHVGKEEHLLSWEQHHLESSSHEGALRKRRVRLCHCMNDYRYQPDLMTSLRKSERYQMLPSLEEPSFRRRKIGLFLERVMTWPELPSSPTQSGETHQLAAMDMSRVMHGGAVMTSHDSPAPGSHKGGTFEAENR